MLFSFLTLQVQAQLKEVVIALKPDKNPEKMLEERQKLEKYLSEQLKVPIKVVVPLSSAVIIEGFKNGSIDLGYLGGLDMHNARKQNAAEILLAGEIKGKTFYESYWVTKKEKTYKSISDLKGKPIAFASRTSTSGYLVPHFALIERKKLKSQEKPESFFGEGNVFYGTGYVSAVERVMQGAAEAAAVSDYVIEGDKHLNPEQKAGLRILDRQGPIPTHVIAARSSLKPADRALLKSALLAINQSQFESLRDQVFTSKLVEVDPAMHLATIQKALELTGADMTVK